jgi:hypothetical protein
MHPFRSTGVLGTARWKGAAGKRGRPVVVGLKPNAVVGAVDQTGVGEGRSTVEAE